MLLVHGRMEIFLKNDDDNDNIIVLMMIMMMMIVIIMLLQRIKIANEGSDLIHN
jgi:hypothetical protein